MFLKIKFLRTSYMASYITVYEIDTYVKEIF